MLWLKITNIILIVILAVLGAETMIKIKRSEGKEIEKIRKSLIIRIDIIMALTVIISIISIVSVILRK